MIENSKPFNPSEYTNYQKDSIVSREIVSKKTGTITLFAFDKGQGLSEHTSPFDAVVFSIEGEAEIVIAGNPVILKQSQLLIMPAGKPHSLKAITQFKMMLIMIRS